MDQRNLGDEGLVVSELGLGCMGMSEFYGTGDEEESTATIHRAIELGITFLDTADMYGPFTNERLVGKAIAGRRDEVVLARTSRSIWSWRIGCARSPKARGSPRGNWPWRGCSPREMTSSLSRGPSAASTSKRTPPEPV